MPLKTLAPLRLGEEKAGERRSGEWGTPDAELPTRQETQAGGRGIACLGQPLGLFLRGGW